MTRRKNDQTYSDLLGIDLAGNPDDAMKPETALFALFHGVKLGTFTGRKNTAYINETATLAEHFMATM
ncbi:MAG: hypothetical protein IT555_17140 [Acetobacteraceae bacterium]|nr:hypothetical protein [Acetobacteraceae bacterium]